MIDLGQFGYHEIETRPSSGNFSIVLSGLIYSFLGHCCILHSLVYYQRHLSSIVQSGQQFIIFQNLGGLGYLQQDGLLEVFNLVQVHGDLDKHAYTYLMSWILCCSKSSLSNFITSASNYSSRPSDVTVKLMTVTYFKYTYFDCDFGHKMGVGHSACHE